MSLNERNSRLVLVFSIIGVLIFLSKQAFIILNNTFSKLDTNVGFSVDHFFSVALVSDVILIFVLSIVYSFYEGHTYSNYAPGKHKHYVTNADKYYQYLISSVLITALISFGFFILIISFPTLISFGISIAVLLLLSLFLKLIIKILAYRNNKLKRYEDKLKSLTKNNINIKIIGLWFFVYVCIFSISALVGLENNFNTNLMIKFLGESKGTARIELIFTDNTNERVPNSFVLSIITPSNLKEINLGKTDFTESFVEVKHRKSKSNLFFRSSVEKVDYKRSSYKLSKIINISDYLEEGTNTILIRFSENNFFDDESISEYRIVNRIIVDNGKIEIGQVDYSLKL